MLDPLQERIARIALALPGADSLALAGGGAMLAHRLVDRQTQETAGQQQERHGRRTTT